MNWVRGRGLLDEIAERAELGFDRKLDAVTIPIRDANGELVNLRRRSVEKRTRGKIVGLSGRGTQLYPLWALKDSHAVIVTEGEIDALTFVQFGLAAITCTGGRAQHWGPDWIELLAGRVVGVAYDSDATVFGQLRVDELRAAGISAYLIDMKRSGHLGKTDANDLIAKHGWTGERLRDFATSFMPGRRRRGRRAA